MEFHCPVWQSQQRILPPRNLSGAAPPVGVPHHGVGPTELPVNSMLDVRHCHSFQFNEISDHEMCYMEADVKPRKEEQPLKTPIFCFKDEKRLREIGKIEDCFIPEFDPDSSATATATAAFPSVLESLLDHDAHFTNVVELEQCREVACRDYPHSRHDCATYPFNSTLDYVHCKMCYCYVCDVPAPCEQWTKQSSYFKHCKATPDIQIWRDLGNAKKRNVDAYFDEFFSEVGVCDEVKQHLNESNKSIARSDFGIEVGKGI